MNRSGYTEDYCYEDPWGMIRWRGAVTRAMRGKRGQAFLKEMVTSLEAMKEKRLVANDLTTPQGEVCALGCVAVARGVRIDDLDPSDSSHHQELGKRLGIAPALVREVEFMNDDSGDEYRWRSVRNWACGEIVPDMPVMERLGQGVHARLKVP